MFSKEVVEKNEETCYLDLEEIEDARIILAKKAKATEVKMDRSKLVMDEIAFEGEEQGYKFKATYLKQPRGKALIEISKDNQIIKEFLFLAYKVWNIAAHARDIVEGLEKESEEGLYLAGSDGLGGNSYGGAKQ